MRWFVAIGTALTLVVVLASCERTSNSGASLIPPTAPSSGGVTPWSLQISVPPTVAPGSLVQFSATAKYSDGSSKDVTTAVMWHSSDTSVLTINNAGVATGHQSGKATVAAAFGSSATAILTASQTITVVPAGTFGLNGRVTSLYRPLEGATVQVTSGIGAGLVTVTSAAGLYQLYGVAGEIQVTVSKTAYSTIQKTVQIVGDTSANFDMVTTNPLPNLAGTYTLRITADSACGTGQQGLPDAARVRQYTATIFNQTNDSLEVPLSDANFLPHANFLFGYRTPDGAHLDVNDLDYYGYTFFPPPDLGEVLADGSVYCPSGTITVSTVGADLVGTLDGAIRIRLMPSGTLAAECTSTHHSLTFMRENANQARANVRR